MNTWTILKRFSEEKLPDKNAFTTVKDKTTGDNGEKSDGHVNDKEYLTCIKIWINLTWEIWTIIMTIIWKNMFCYWLMFLKSLLTRV